MSVTGGCDAQSPRATGLKKHRGQRRLFGFLTVRRWLQLARSLSATRWETLRRVIVPGVLGNVLTGVRLAIGILWIVLVPCEMLGVSAGLGYYILDTRDRLAYSELMAMVLLICVLGFCLDTAARSLYTRWNHGASR